MKREFKILLGIAAGFALLSWVFAPLRSGREIQVAVQWSYTGTSNTPGTKPSDESALVWTPSHLMQVDSKAAIRSFAISPGEDVLNNENYWIRYPLSNGQGFIVNFHKQSTINEFRSNTAYPVLGKESFGAISSNAQDLSWFSTDGIVQWRFSAAAQIRAVEELEDGSVLLQDIDGSLDLIGPGGSVRSRRAIQQNRTQSIGGYGLANLNEKHFAVVAGLQPQLLSVLELRENTLHELWSLELGKGFARDVLIQSINNGEKIFLEADGAFLLVSTDTGSYQRFPISTWIRKVLELPALNLFLLLSDSAYGSFIDAWDYKGNKKYASGPHAPISDVVSTPKNTVYIASNDTLFCLAWSQSP